MTKLCPRGKAAAKRKFAVYPSAYANAYASKICAGKIKDPSGKKRKDFKGPKPAGKKFGGMTAGSQSAMGRLQKARMMNEGGDSKVKKSFKEIKKENRKQKLKEILGGDVSVKQFKDLYHGRKFKKGGDSKVKKVISNLKKASKAHAGQAKTLQSVVKKSVGGMADYYKDLM